jgi:hypothetical protein
VDLRPTAQGILMAIHHGLGRAMGTIIGGAFVHSYGKSFLPQHGYLIDFGQKCRKTEQKIKYVFFPR